MNIRQTRNKIKSVTNVRKITKAMQLVSAIKMKKAQQLAVEGRPYEEHLENIIKKVVLRIDVNLSSLLSVKLDMSKRKDLIIVVATNKGLCGGFNMNLFRFMVKNVDFNNVEVVIVGKKASILTKFGAKIIADYSANAPLDNVSALFELALSHFLQRSHQHIILFYNKFISTLRAEPVKQVLLPLILDIAKPAFSRLSRDSTGNGEYLIEPNPEEIINPLLYSYIEEKIRNAIIQTEAGEHSSRMIAMKNATDNANDVIYNLTMLRNKLRQEKITNELLDMVTAKESVEAS